MDEKIKELGTYIDNLRQEKNLGFNQLSKKSGVNAKTLNEIMYGKSKRVNPVYLIQLAKALGVHYKQFYWIIGYLLPEDDIVKNKKIVSHHAKAYRGEVLRQIANKLIKNKNELMSLNFKNLKLIDMKKFGLKTELMFEICE